MMQLPNLYIWLIMFYVFFHLWLNIVAEVRDSGSTCLAGDVSPSHTRRSFDLEIDNFTETGGMPQL
jgi:hypothetical protein